MPKDTRVRRAINGSQSGPDWAPDPDSEFDSEGYPRSAGVTQGPIPSELPIKFVNPDERPAPAKSLRRDR
jgi:hypothetical protein